MMITFGNGSHPMTKKFIFSKVKVFVYIRFRMTGVKLCHNHSNKTLALSEDSE